MAHAFRTGLVKNLIRGKSHNSRFNKNIISVIRDAIYNGHSCSAIARYFKVNKSSVIRIKNGEHWSHV